MNRLGSQQSMGLERALSSLPPFLDSGIEQSFCSRKGNFLPDASACWNWVKMAKVSDVLP